MRISVLFGLASCVALVFHRPMIFGYFNVFYGTAVCLLLTTLAVTRRRSLTFDVTAYRVFVTNILAAIFFAILISVYADAEQALKGVAINFVFITACLALFSGEKKDEVAVGLKYGLRLIVVFGLLSSVLTNFDFNQVAELEMVRLPLKDRGEMTDFAVLFPLSTIPYPMTFPDYVLARNTYLTIEPGVAPLLLLIWRVLEGRKEGKVREILFDAVFLCALVSTLSTTAPLFVFIYFGVRNMLDGRKLLLSHWIILILMLFFSLFVLFYAPYIGILDKMNTHGTSFEERQSWYSTDGGVSLRVFLIPVLFAYYISIRKFVDNRFRVLYLGAAVVSLLNVAAFTPVFYLISFISSRQYQWGKPIYR